MFRWGIIFLVIALIAAALGFGGLAGTAAGAAKIVFVVGLAFAVLANNKLRYFVILSQQKQEGRGGAANICNAW